MADGPSIARQTVLPPALDYGFLRAEGLAHIQRLSSTLWTDHNQHDPGITTLEILCYALTDLAYRMGFRSEEHTSELQSQSNLVCRLLLEKKKKTKKHTT